MYCDEMGYEDREAFPDQREMDAWDAQSAHFLVRHRYSGHWVGALRMVFPKSSELPFEEWSIPGNPITTQQYKRSIEISRLCVIKEARRFVSKCFAPYGLADEESSRLESSNVRSFFNHKQQSRSIMWGLFRAAVVHSAQIGIKHWYILVTPALAYCVNKEGFAMKQVAEPCDHRGQRIPYCLDVEHILANPLWEKDYKQGYTAYSELEYVQPSKIRLAR